MNRFKVLSSICYKYVPHARRKKLDDKSEIMILIGYHETGVCKLFNLINEKIIISIDIIIDENDAWNWTSNGTSSKLLLNLGLEEEKEEEEEEEEKEEGEEEEEEALMDFGLFRVGAKSHNDVI